MNLDSQFITVAGFAVVIAFNAGIAWLDRKWMRSDIAQLRKAINGDHDLLATHVKESEEVRGKVAVLWDRYKP